MPRPFALLPLVLVLAAFPIARAAEKAGEKSQETEIRTAIVTLEECFNRGDAKSLAACFSPDGEFLGPSGDRVDGREKVEAAFRDFLTKHKSFKLRLGIVSWRLATDGVALVDLLTDMTPLPEGLESAPTFHVVLVKRDGQWLIEQHARSGRRRSVAPRLPKGLAMDGGRLGGIEQTRVWRFGA